MKRHTISSRSTLSLILKMTQGGVEGKGKNRDKQLRGIEMKMEERTLRRRKTPKQRKRIKMKMKIW